MLHAFTWQMKCPLRQMSTAGQKTFPETSCNQQMSIRISDKFPVFFHVIVIVIIELNLMSSAQCKINVSGFKKDTPMYYSEIMHVHVLITKGQCNTSWNFAFHYKSDKVRKGKEHLLISHVSFWWSCKNVTEVVRFHVVSNIIGKWVEAKI